MNYDLNKKHCFLLAKCKHNEHTKAIKRNGFKLFEVLENSKDYPNLLKYDLIYKRDHSNVYLHMRYRPGKTEITFLSLSEFDFSILDSSILYGIRHITNNPIVTNAIVESLSV